MSVTVTTRDTGFAALMARLLKAASERVLTVGIHEEEGAGAHGDATIADLGAIHEFGLGVPARSFIGEWAEGKEPDHKAAMTKMGEALVKGSLSDPAKGMAQLGVKYEGEVKQRIAGGIAPPNAPATVARKGSSTPLIDTGVLRSSIASRVE